MPTILWAHLSRPVIHELLALPDILVHILHLPQANQAVQPDPDEHAAKDAKDEAGQGPGEEVRAGHTGVLVGTVCGDEEGEENDGYPDGHDGEETDPEFGLIQAD